MNQPETEDIKKLELENEALKSELKAWNVKFEDEVYKRTLALQESLKKLEVLNQMRSQFVSIMSHELRTPTAALIGYSDALRQKWSDLPKEKVIKYLDVIAEESNRMVMLMQEIFEISSILEGKLNLALEKRDIIPLITSAVQNYRARNGNCSFGFNESTEPIDARVDAIYFKSAISHVLSNAVKYTPSKGNILVFAERKGDQAVIRVEDDGPGVPREYREKVFEPFFRSMDNVNRQTPGAGLGLTIARGIFQALQGSVQIAEKMTGKNGCAVILTLPLSR